ncbi:Rv1355c family protein [Pedobacter deserti]|uniref:Rv1355c family protein n=1 Tax=Pedobacter deserti TaxID=2817382 RepID=UPI0021088B12|nr:Rv1355c family protein [Pedobacter sp. SYSU D00382]
MHFLKDNNNFLKEAILTTELQNDVYLPTFFRINKEEDEKALKDLLLSAPHIQVFDTIYHQLKDLIKSINPNRVLDDRSIRQAIEAHLNGTDISVYGVWVYYPWLGKVVHILDEQEYITVRTNRNKHKITQEEQDRLAEKKIGVIGLSVGQSVSLTLAIERGFGELRIADFDTLDLTNLNRIRCGVHNVNLKKTVIVAREIAEIDPFLKVVPFHEGITENNLEEFLAGNGKLNLLIDECDSIDIKINCRVKAREMGIPVVMEASDRGTIDIERFDLEPERPILHGSVAHLDISRVKDLKTSEEKLPYMVPISGLETLSPRMKASAIEIMQTITTWPQLSSAVTYGGGITADLSRKILLDSLHVSGRFFIDIDELISDPPKERELQQQATPPLTVDDMDRMSASSSVPDGEPLGSEELELMVTAAGLAPSGGNSQPWKWHYKNNILHLFFDKSCSDAFLDFNDTSSMISLGAAIENLLLTAEKERLEVIWEYASSGFPTHVASFRFKKNKEAPSELSLKLAAQIGNRHTNRKNSSRVLMAPEEMHHLSKVVTDVPGAEIEWVFDVKRQQQIGEIVAETDLMRFFTPEAHWDFIHREMRWTPEEVESRKDGIGVHTLDLGMNDLIGLRLLKDPQAIDFLKKINGGTVFKKVSVTQMATASAIGLVTMPTIANQNFLEGGRAVERLWLAASAYGYQMHPLSVPLAFFYRNIHGKGAGLDRDTSAHLTELRRKFCQIFDTNDEKAEIFLFRLFKASDSEMRTIRKPIKDTLSIGN